MDSGDRPPGELSAEDPGAEHPPVEVSPPGTGPEHEVVPGDTANVLWTQPEDNAIFASFRDDVPASRRGLTGYAAT